MFTRTALVLFAACSSYVSFAQIDTTIGCSTPSGAGNTYQQLAHSLCDQLPEDQQKANAIYNWITHNIEYDVKAMQQGKLKEEDPEKVFKQRKGMCEGYSLLFAAMCNEVDVKAITIDGYSKDWMFDDGDKFYIPRHAWNVVRIDNRWKLVDATWGAGSLTQAPGWLKRTISKASKSPLQTSGKLKFEFSYDTAYFLSDPLVFRLKHLPSDPVWQLTDTSMPLAVFEAGETAIKQFNKQYPALREISPLYDSLSKMDLNMRVQASAQRISDYNPRYHVVMAAKHQADALDTIAANVEGISPEAEKKALTAVQERLKVADDEVGEQKKAITKEYTALTSKNKTKSVQANQYIRSLRSDNKKMIGQCESQVKKANSLVAAIDTKADKAHDNSKNINAYKITTIATSPVQTSDRDASLTVLIDSVHLRNKTIDSLKRSIQQQHAILVAEKKENGGKLDTLASIFTLADSALTEETINRIRMHDNYDEEVLQWNRIVKNVRLRQVDTLQKDYFLGYDSINNHYENLRKAQWEQMDLYRKNLKDIERYKRKNNQSSFLGQYASQVKGYNACLNDALKSLADHKGYIVNNQTLCKALVTLYRRQDELAGYMEKSEEKRKQLEEKSLAKKEAFDKKENDKQKEQLKDTAAKAEKALSMK